VKKQPCLQKISNSEFGGLNFWIIVVGILVVSVGHESVLAELSLLESGLAELSLLSVGHGSRFACEFAWGLAKLIGLFCGA
jgi:hypothetical protein